MNGRKLAFRMVEKFKKDPDVFQSDFDAEELKIVQELKCGTIRRHGPFQREFLVATLGERIARHRVPQQCR